MTNSKIGPYGARTYGVNVKHGLGSTGMRHTAEVAGAGARREAGAQVLKLFLRCAVRPRRLARDQPRFP